jgi:hypothetical protein
MLGKDRRARSRQARADREKQLPPGVRIVKHDNQVTGLGVDADGLAVTSPRGRAWQPVARPVAVKRWGLRRTSGSWCRLGWLFRDHLAVGAVSVGCSVII